MVILLDRCLSDVCLRGRCVRCNGKERCNVWGPKGITEGRCWLLSTARWQRSRSQRSDLATQTSKQQSGTATASAPAQRRPRRSPEVQSVLSVCSPSRHVSPSALVASNFRRISPSPHSACNYHQNFGLRDGSVKAATTNTTGTPTAAMKCMYTMFNRSKM